jgi:hypothetical protein
MNIYQINATTTLMISGIELLSLFAKDYQLEPHHPEYTGFLNVSIDDMIEWASTWSYVCENPHIFIPVISQLGMSLEGGRLNQEETVFYVK